MMFGKKLLLSCGLLSLALNSVWADEMPMQTTTLSTDGKVQWRVDNKPDYVVPVQTAVQKETTPVVKKKTPRKENKRSIDKPISKKSPPPPKPVVEKKSPPPVVEKTVEKTPTPPKVPAETVEKKTTVTAKKKSSRTNAYKWKKPVLALDSGYSIHDPGMAGVRGMREVEYNDRFVKELIPRIEAAGWEVKLTRGEYGYVSDVHRAEQANIWEADLLLSIHHDVSPKRYLKSETKDGVTMNKSTQSFEGYSMYVSKRNKKYRASLCFAQRLGFRLKPLQRDPAYFHKEHEGLPLVVKEYGIYERDIPILREAEIPAVQVKIGVVTDASDEAWINNDQYRHDIESAVIKTIRVFKQYCSYW